MTGESGEQGLGSLLTSAKQRTSRGTGVGSPCAGQGILVKLFSLATLECESVLGGNPIVSLDRCANMEHLAVVILVSIVSLSISGAREA